MQCVCVCVRHATVHSKNRTVRFSRVLFACFNVFAFMSSYVLKMALIN
uniref:Uncharacterized protein n=1 Tax=Anguilla anguilla TaxID=7936 RepID=A0A0E9VLZ3_ANGAN